MNSQEAYGFVKSNAVKWFNQTDLAERLQQSLSAKEITDVNFHRMLNGPNNTFLNQVFHILTTVGFYDDLSWLIRSFLDSTLFFDRFEIPRSVAELSASYPNQSGLLVSSRGLCKDSTNRHYHARAFVDMLTPRLYLGPAVSTVSIYVKLGLFDTLDSNQDFGVTLGLNNLVIHVGASKRSFCDAFRVEGPQGYHNLNFPSDPPSFGQLHPLKIVAHRSGQVSEDNDSLM
jgi:hypothetical protein